MRVILMISSNSADVDKILLGNWVIDVKDEKLMFTHASGETIGFAPEKDIESNPTLMSGTCVANTLHLDDINLSNWKIYSANDRLIFDYNNEKEIEII